MSRSLAVDPNWTASDLLERSRRLAAMASPVAGTDRGSALIAAEVEELQATCAQVAATPLPELSRRRAAHVLEALDQLSVAADDLAAIVELRCAGTSDREAAAAPPRPDLVGLVARVAERHDRAVGLLGRYGIQRTHISP